MKLSTVTLAALAVTALAILPSFTAPAPTAVQEGRERSELAEAMQTVNRGLRQLRGVLKDDAKMMEKLPDVVALQSAVLASKEHLPAKVTALTDAKKKAEETAAYRKDMNTFLRGLLDVEEAFLAGDGDAAKKSLQALERLKRTSHDRFQERGR